MAFIGYSNDSRPAADGGKTVNTMVEGGDAAEWNRSDAPNFAPSDFYRALAFEQFLFLYNVNDLRFAPSPTSARLHFPTICHANALLFLPCEKKRHNNKKLTQFSRLLLAIVLKSCYPALCFYGERRGGGGGGKGLQ